MSSNSVQEAYELGKKAFKDGNSKHKNPFELGTAEALSWYHGWIDG